MLIGMIVLGGHVFAQDQEMEEVSPPSTQPYMPPQPPPPPPSPWFTGPLIAPVGTVVPYGDFSIESYVYFTTNTGTYNSDWKSVSAPRNFYSLNPQFLCFFGLTSWCDINIIPEFFYNVTSHEHSIHFGDLTVGLDFQLLAADATPYFPGIKFAIREVFPTGNFQHLHPHKLLTDQTGAGTFGTQFDLVLYKVFHIRGQHWLSLTISGQYQLNSPVHVHGLNTYGGGAGTRGFAMPGNSFQGIVSFEYTLNQNWVLALDNVYTHTDRTQFCGDTVASVGSSSSEQLEFAPAIEYNFSSHFGLIAGCWFTAAGRNSTEFRSGVINFVYTY